jgi:hypothetical protein
LVIGSSAGANILRGKGDGTFQSPLIFPAATISGSIAAVDSNSDHASDLITVGGGVVTVLLNTSGASVIKPGQPDAP